MEQYRIRMLEDDVRELKEDQKSLKNNAIYSLLGVVGALLALIWDFIRRGGK